ncbi:hypothetical protein [Streptomyces sp. UH6]
MRRALTALVALRSLTPDAPEVFLGHLAGVRRRTADLEAGKPRPREGG